ncbi:MAG: hypothetical protein HGA82_03425, partial [Anaerolineales bacterium]|nr:hypothetical protein [Anaerolineales bacterium]
MMTMIGLAVVRLANDEVTIAGNELNEMAAFYAAEAGLERASAAIQTQYEATGLPPSTMPQGSETINNCVAAYTTVDNGAATMQDLALGALAGRAPALPPGFQTDPPRISLPASLIPVTRADPRRDIAPSGGSLVALAFPTHGGLPPWSVIKFLFRMPRRTG